MTTLELMEKHGIGHNCLSDAYDLGYQQGRAEAIDAYKKKIEFEEKWLWDCKVFNPNVTIAFETLKSYAEQLKEK